MTHQETADAYVREKFPELMELSFGCEVQWKNARAFITGETYLVGSKTMYCIMPRMGGIDSFKEGNSEIEILGHPIQLQHWLRVLEMIDSKDVMHYSVTSSGDLMHDHYGHAGQKQCRGWDYVVEPSRIKFNLTTGQPATEADYQAFNDIVEI